PPSGSGATPGVFSDPSTGWLAPVDGLEEPHRREPAGMFLFMLLIAVPVGLALAIVIDLADSRRQHADTGNEDAHPVFARPTPNATSVFDVARSRPAERRVVRPRVRPAKMPVGAARRPRPRRQALPLH